jgi:hypothetical protein
MDTSARAREPLWMRAFGVAILGGLLWVGCACSHQRAEDAGLDAGSDAPRVDDTGTDAHADDTSVPVEGPYWVPIDVTETRVAHDRCAVREGQTLVLRVSLAIDGCDEPGNVRWRVDVTRREITLSPFAWRRLGVAPCPPTRREVTRDVALRGAPITAGSWTLLGPDGVATSLVVDGPLPELPCTDCRAPGETCAVDQECEGARECLSVLGDAACAAQCAASCEPFVEDASIADPSCAYRLGVSAACVEDPNLGWTCGASPLPCTTCPAGMACEADGCAWVVTPWPERCDTDADCPDGRSCVALPDSLTRTCWVRCRGDHPCPLGERCGASDQVCPPPKI